MAAVQHRPHSTRKTAAASASNAAGGTLLPKRLAAEAPQTQQPEHDAPQQGRRKIGRPIEFTGDIDSADLTNAERRRLRRSPTRRCIVHT